MEKLKKKLTREDFVNWGRVVGMENKKKGKLYFSNLGKKGALARWGNKKIV